jgi:hypothetical protein
MGNVSPKIVRRMAMTAESGRFKADKNQEVVCK